MSLTGFTKMEKQNIFKLNGHEYYMYIKDFKAKHRVIYEHTSNLIY